MNWFFDQVLYGTEICDYRVSGVTSRKITGYSGIADGDSVTFTRSDRKSDTLYLARVGIERIGGMMLPVEVLVSFDNGDEVIEEWDGKERFRDFEYTGTRKVTRVIIDPDNKIDLDINRINNSWTDDPQFTASGRMMTKFVFLMQMMISLFTI
jgi:hypothetical protein